MTIEKKGTMLNLEVDLVERSKSLGINMSNVVNVTLRYLIEGGSLQPTRTDLVLVQQDIERVKNDLSLRRLEIEGLQGRLVSLTEEEARLKDGLAVAERDTGIAKILERLRSAIVTGVSLEELATSTDVIELGDLLMMNVTMEWLVAFKERVIKHE